MVTVLFSNFLGSILTHRKIPRLTSGLEPSEMLSRKGREVTRGTGSDWCGNQ